MSKLEIHRPTWSQIACELYLKDIAVSDSGELYPISHFSEPADLYMELMKEKVYPVWAFGDDKKLAAISYEGIKSYAYKLGYDAFCADTTRNNSEFLDRLADSARQYRGIFGELALISSVELSDNPDASKVISELLCLRSANALQVSDI